MKSCYTISMLFNKINSPVLVFTDLDGTLLDHNTYSFDPALEMLDFLKENAIALIIVTSKTKSEVIELQKALGITAPFIVENGAGIFLPQEEGYEMIPLGKLYNETRNAFLSYAKDVSMRGFADMPVEEIAIRTTLSLEDARRASQRDFSEPFILENEHELAKLKKMAQKDGFDIVKGGRFYHLITQGQDKAAAIRKVIDLYNDQYETTFTSIALGDSENDLTMLQNVDVPVLIPHPDGSYTPFTTPNLIKAPYPGPKGWNESLKRYFNVQ